MTVILYDQLEVCKIVIIMCVLIIVFLIFFYCVHVFFFDCVLRPALEAMFTIPSCMLPNLDPVNLHRKTPLGVPLVTLICI